MSLLSQHWQYDHLEAVATAQEIVENDSPYQLESETDGIAADIFFTGSDIHSIMSNLQRYITDHDVLPRYVIVPDLRSFGSTAGEIASGVSELLSILSSDTALCLGRESAESGFRQFDPEGKDIFYLSDLCRWIDEVGVNLQRAAERHRLRRWVDIDNEGGPAGLGFEWVDGEVVPALDYDEVCAVLDLVQSGEMSKRQAAADLDTSPRTITRCIEERPERYGLD